MEFDYIVVGAGSAGCVVAARLAEQEGVRVALLEAGPADDRPEMEIPAFLGLLHKSDVDWDFHSDPEPGLDGRRGYLPRGRMLGGSSSINGMVYIRGNAADFAEWESLGNQGWGYEDVLPYFRLSEDNERGEDEYHGVGGPVGVSDSRSGYAISDAWVAAAVQAGYPHNADFNGATQEGVGRYQVFQRNGARASTSRSYLPTAEATGRLTVLTDAYATLVRIEGGRARAVEMIRHGERQVIEAAREIIVCAGAYQSPQLLMLSGVGPADQLRGVGVEVIEDLPVGENLLDHPMVIMSFLTSVPGIFSGMTPDTRAQWEADRRGPLTSNLAEAGGFIRSTPGLDLPDIQFHAGVGTYEDHGLGKPFANGQCCGPNIAKPTSVGTVTLRSAVPTAKPRILHNFLATEEDRTLMVQAMHIALDIVAQPALRKVHISAHRAPASRSESDIMDFIHRTCQTDYHAAGTCSLGTVVDSQLCVRGIDGLRVADASVFPKMIRGNTNAAVIMIAERAADFIKADAGQPVKLAAARS